MWLNFTRIILLLNAKSCKSLLSDQHKHYIYPLFKCFSVPPHYHTIPDLTPLYQHYLSAETVLNSLLHNHYEQLHVECLSVHPTYLPSVRVFFSSTAPSHHCFSWKPVLHHTREFILREGNFEADHTDHRVYTYRHSMFYEHLALLN